MLKIYMKKIRNFLTFLIQIIEHISIQQFLYFFAFITFGICDALTGHLLMSIKGVNAESNVIFQQMYSVQGPGMFIFTKLWIVMSLLFFVFILSLHSHKKSYWMTNGFLAALSIGGLMATQANLQAINGQPFMNPSTIILFFLTIMLIFLETGDLIDTQGENTNKKNVNAKIQVIQ